MKTTKPRSIISELILACFILSIFLLLENKKESNAANSANLQGADIEINDASKAQRKNSISYSIN